MKNKEIINHNDKIINQMKLFGLHGHLQNFKQFKGKIGGLLHQFKKIGVEIIFLDSPYICEESAEDPPLRTWVHDNSIKLAEESIIEAKKAHPEVCGFFCFSMGSMFALHLAAHAATHTDSPFSWVKIIVAASAPYPKPDSPLLDGFPCKCDIPVLFVIGKSDEIAPPDSQKKYLPSFPNATIFEHDGGHYVPVARQYVQTYIDFFTKCKEIIEL